MKKHLLYTTGLLLILFLPVIGMSLQSYDTIVEKLESSSGTQRIDLLNRYSSLLTIQNPEKAIDLANKALELAVDLKDNKRKAESYFNIADGLKNKGENIQALNYFLKSQNTYKDIDDQKGIARSSNYCGMIYRFLGDYSSALDYHLKSLRIYQDLDELEGITQSLVNAGVAYRNLGNETLALDFYNQAIDNSKQLNDNNTLVDALVSKGNIYWYRGDSDKALYYYEEALRITENSPGGTYDISGILNNMGNVYRQRGDYEKALDYYHKSIAGSREHGDKNMIAVTTKNIGITYKLAGNLSKAIEKLNESKNLAAQIRLASVHKESLEQLSQTYVKMHEYQDALQYYKEFAELKENLSKEQANNKISVMQLGYHLKDEAQKQSIREVDLNLEVLKERNIRNVIISIALLSVALIFILWNRYRMKLRTNLELKQLNADLEKRVEERTKQLREENERRRIAQEHAEQANETKNRFLANISHEVRTPINAIIGFCDLTFKESVDSKIKINLQRIKDSTQHLLALIKDILDYSQIDYGRTELKKVSFNLKEIIDSVVNAFYLDTKSKNIALSLNIDENVPLNLAGDKDAIRQIMYNLVGNAVKFTDKGKVDIRIKVAESGKSNDYVKLLFSVKDTGIGISKLKQKLIFMDFTQEHDESTRKYGGAGLGLTITKHFIELMDGTIWVESEKGKGSNFIFTIRLKKDSVQPKEPDVSAEKELKNLHVLIAEDNMLNAQVITAFLSRLGHTSEVANNGIEALNILSKNDFDAVLMDIEMPEMDGIEATKAIRHGKENVRDPQIPIVALTAHALKDYEDKSRDAGMNHYLTKPVDIEQLSQVLQHL